MAERLQTLIHTWQLSEEARASIVFSGADIRLDPKRHVVELKADPVLGYPTTGDQYIITPLFQPASVRQWRMIQVGITHKTDGIDQVTGDGYRLHDGTNQWWWDGAAWAISVADWNTEAEINAHIGDFDVDDRKLRLVIRLSTTDTQQTPTLEWVKLAWKGRVNWLEDVVYRSLVPYVRNVTSVVDIALKAPIPASAIVAVGTAVNNTGIPFNVVDCNAVFNYDDDPDRANNLLASWDQSLKQATLTAAQTGGANLIVEVVVQPLVAVETTSQDYSEVEKVPAIIITDISDDASSPCAADDGVVDKATGAAIRLPGAYRCDIRFSMIVLAAGAVDLARMVSDLTAYVENNPLITTRATDRQYRLWMLSEFSTRTKPNSNDVHTTQSTFVIKDVLAFNKPAVDEVGVMSVKFRGDMDVDVDAP